MPLSNADNWPPIADFLESLQPEGIVDLGIGAGFAGAVVRNYLEGRHGCCRPDQWGVRLIGFEGFADYRNPMWELYDHVYIEDFSKPEIYEGLKGWPLVMICDAIEHVEKTEAMIILQTLVENNTNVLVSVPLGTCEQGACFGNDFECHRSTWNGTGDFSNFKYQILHKGGCLVVNLKGLVE